MISALAPWQDLAGRLRPFIARRVPPDAIDDVLHDVFVRYQRGVGALRDADRLAPWLYQVARSAIADHLRARQRHPLARTDATPELAVDPAPLDDDGAATSRALAGCVAAFVARLASPYREAVTLVELQGLTAREAAALAGLSVSGMKSRVQRGRAQLRALFEACCDIALDTRGAVMTAAPRPCRGCAAPGASAGSVPCPA